MSIQLVDSLLKIGKLKNVKRSGWVREGMANPESVAEHTFRVCFLVLILAEELKIDEHKLLKMALVHDLEEAVTGDPVTQRGAKDIGQHDHKMEKLLFKEIVSEVPNAKEMYNLWEEHLPQNRQGATQDSIILYELGKIATVWQALEYELSGVNPKKLNEFWINAKTHVKEPVLVKLLKEMESRRK